MKKINRKARFDYNLLETLEAGIALSGQEVKAVKEGNVDLQGAHAKIIDGEVYLINVNISGTGEGYEPTRTRKLLLHKNQIVSIASKIKGKKLTLVPVSVYTTRGLVKIELALAKPKRKFEKRKKIKDRDIKRDVERELKDR
jgi:SsrA-binding protein